MKSAVALAAMFVVFCAGQTSDRPPDHTYGRINGRVWRTLSSDEKLLYLTGYKEGVWEQSQEDAAKILPAKLSGYQTLTVSTSGHEPIIPIAVKLVSPELEFSHLLVGNLEAGGIGIGVEFALH